MTLRRKFLGYSFVVMFMEDFLKTAFITGASSGIGEAIALRLARDGLNIIVHYNSNEKGALETKRRVEEFGSKAYLFQYDLSVNESLESDLEIFLKGNNLSVDALVNNAGVTKDNLFPFLSDNDLDFVLKTNLFAPFILMRFFSKLMLRKRSGTIVNISSISGEMGNAGQANYAASKAGLVALTKSLAREMGKRNIRANSIAVGIVETKMIQDVQGLEEMKKQIPLGRFGRPEEIASVVSFLVSDDSSYITGQVINVNGGLYTP
jgi:3-oxoacyl-[acyl-carrier protein] reductase